MGLLEEYESRKRNIGINKIRQIFRYIKPHSKNLPDFIKALKYRSSEELVNFIKHLDDREKNGR